MKKYLRIVHINEIKLNPAVRVYNLTEQSDVGQDIHGTIKINEFSYNETDRLLSRYLCVPP